MGFPRRSQEADNDAAVPPPRQPKVCLPGANPESEEELDAEEGSEATLPKVLSTGGNSLQPMEGSEATLPKVLSTGGNSLQPMAPLYPKPIGSSVPASPLARQSYDVALPRAPRSAVERLPTEDSVDDFAPMKSNLSSVTAMMLSGVDSAVQGAGSRQGFDGELQRLEQRLDELAGEAKAIASAMSRVLEQRPSRPFSTLAHSGAMLSPNGSFGDLLSTAPMMTDGFSNRGAGAGGLRLAAEQDDAVTQEEEDDLLETLDKKSPRKFRPKTKSTLSISTLGDAGLQASPRSPKTPASPAIARAQSGEAIRASPQAVEAMRSASLMKSRRPSHDLILAVDSVPPIPTKSAISHIKDGIEDRVRRMTSRVSGVSSTLPQATNSIGGVASHSSVSRQRSSMRGCESGGGIPRVRGTLGFIRDLAQRLTQHRRFEVCVAAVIFLNAVVIGIQSDWAVKNIGKPSPDWILHMQLFFTTFFTFELLLRIVDEGCLFFSWYNPNWRWNMFDTLIVSAAVLEEAFASRTANVTTAPNVSAIRVLRIVRLFRIFRVLRVMRFFRELRTMVQGIMSSVRSLVWCLLLMCILIFIFGVCVLQIVSDALEEQAILGTGHADKQKLLKHFGSIVSTVYTLFGSITGGVNWVDPIESIVDTSPLIAFVYCIYTSVAVFCVLNIVTGVFVENANAITRSDADNMVMEELSAREKWMDEMRAVFELADKDGTGALNIHQFCNYVCDVRVQAYFRKIGLNVEKDNAKALFSLIDLDLNGVIELEEFVEGCAQFVGTARQLDIARLRRENQLIIRSLKELRANLLGGLEKTLERGLESRLPATTQEPPK